MGQGIQEALLRIKWPVWLGQNMDKIWSSSGQHVVNCEPRSQDALASLRRAVFRDET